MGYFFLWVREPDNILTCFATPALGQNPLRTTIPKMYYIFNHGLVWNHMVMQTTMFWIQPGEIWPIYDDPGLTLGRPNYFPSKWIIESKYVQSETTIVVSGSVQKAHLFYDISLWVALSSSMCVCQICEQSIALATFTLQAAASFDKISADLRIPRMWLRTRIITSTVVYLNRHKTAFKVRLLWVNDNIPQTTMGCTLI